MAPAFADDFCQVRLHQLDLAFAPPRRLASHLDASQRAFAKAARLTSHLGCPFGPFEVPAGQPRRGGQARRTLSGLPPPICPNWRIR